MLENSRMRTPEQKSRKMLKEENTILDLELAIKKELYKMSQKTKLALIEEPTEDKDLQMTASVNEKDVKTSNILNSFLNKIGF